MTGILVTAQGRGCLLQSDVWCVKPDALGSRKDFGRHSYCHSAVGGWHDRGPDSFFFSSYSNPTCLRCGKYKSSGKWYWGLAQGGDAEGHLLRRFGRWFWGLPSQELWEVMLRATSSGALGGDTESHLWEVMLGWSPQELWRWCWVLLPQSPGGFRTWRREQKCTREGGGTDALFF